MRACRALALAAALSPVEMLVLPPPLFAVVPPAQMTGTLALRDSLLGCPVSRRNSSRPASRAVLSWHCSVSMRALPRDTAAYFLSQCPPGRHRESMSDPTWTGSDMHQLRAVTVRV